MKKYLVLYIIAMLCVTRTAFAQLQLTSPAVKKEVPLPFLLKTVLPASSKIVAVHIMEIRKPFVVGINPAEMMAKARAKCDALKNQSATLTLKADRTNNATASLEWETKYAFKASGFNIERSLADSFHFTTVHFANATINGGAKKNYKLPDYNDYSGPSFYRVKLLTSDTTYLYSNIAAVKGYSVSAFLIYPNPASEKVLIAFTSKQTGNATIMIYDAAGKVVQQLSLNCIKDVFTQKSVAVSTLARGVYHIQILMSDKTSMSGTFVKG